MPAMPTWYAVKMRLPCPECGESSFVDGPWSSVRCPHCGATTDIEFLWQKVLDRARREGQAEFQNATYLDTSRPVAANQYSFASGLAPTCTCSAAMDVDAIPDGADGLFACGACGAQHDTFSAPPHLQSLQVRQVFLAVREDQQLVTPDAPDARPIMFSCTSCGAALRITTETARIVRCEYCDVDLFLPAALWNQLHPVRRRRAFWLRSA